MLSTLHSPWDLMVLCPDICQADSAAALQICAEELELGRAIWEAHAAGDTLESFCSAAEGQQYLMGLGHVRFASCVLSSAVRQPAVAAAVQPQHHAHLVRCTSAWDAPTQGEEN